MDTVYNIIDAKAVLKHAFFSAGNADADADVCPLTDRKIPTWEFAAQHVLTRYEDLFFGEYANPRFLIVAHDMGHEYRSAVYEGYKKKRDMREKSEIEVERFEKLLQWFKNFAATLGATQVGVEGVEADDVIAWLCQNLSGMKRVFTVDADLLQLAGNDTLVFLKNEVFTEEDKDGIPLHLTSIAKSIIGDSSDEYGGVPQMGPAKFIGLLEDYGEDGILQLQSCVESNNTTLLEQAIEETGDKRLIKLLEHFDTWRMMWKLAQLHPELCWKPRARKLTKPLWFKRVANDQRLFAMLKKVGAEDLWPKFEPMMPRALLVDNTNWDEMRDAIFAEIAAGDVVAFDYETADKNPHQPFNEAYAGRGDYLDMLSHRLTGASFQFGKYLENVIYVTVDHAGASNLDPEVIALILNQARKTSRLVAHNFYFEGIITRTNLDIKLSQVHDTQIMQRYANENEEYGLKAMSKAMLGYEQTSFKDTLNGKANMAELTVDEVFKYGTDDSLVTGALYDLLKMQLMVDGTWDFYQRWAVDGTCVLQDSFVNGVNMDMKAQAEVHRRDVETVDTCIAELREVLAEHCNGEITSGCRSYIDAESDFVKKGHRRKLRDDKGLKGDELAKAVSAKVYEWKTKFERACMYTPYQVEEIMPDAKVTATTLNSALEVLGMDPIEKLTQKAVAEYLTDHGMIGGNSDLLPDYDDQRELLKMFADGVAADMLRISTLQGQYERAVEGGDDEKAGKLYDAVEAATDAYNKFAAYLQKIVGVEPKVIATGDELSLNSNPQMLQLIYAKIGVPVRLRSTGTLSKARMVLGFRENGPATDEKAIETALANDVEKGSWQEKALRLLLKAKSAQTRIGLYHKTYPLWQHPKDGKLHPSFTLCGTDTRRPTGSSPNVLQVSKKAPEMRDLFVPPTKNHVVVAIDYASQEIRIMACEANDPVMKSVYNPEDEKDLHSMTGSGIAKMQYRDFVTAYEDPKHELHALTKAVRGKKAKGVNFGLAYGAGAGTISRNLIVPLEEARTLLDDAFGLYARIKPWQAETAKFMERMGFTLTAFGTKRHATDDIFAKDKGKVARVHRQGTNATIQGAAAEMLQMVLTGIWESGMLDRLDMTFFAPVYDEVVSFVHKDDVVEYCREMNRIMSDATPPGHEIPQVPEFSIGPKWGTLIELGRWPGEDAIVECVDEVMKMKDAA